MSENITENLDDLQIIKSKVGLVLGLPFGRQLVRREWALAMETIAWPLNVTIMHAAVFDRKISEARETICEQAVAVGAPFIWFVDDDTVPISAAPRLLMYQLEQHPEAIAIGGIYCSKTDPPQPMVFQDFGTGSDWNWKVGEVFECKAIGTGCMMIRTELLKTLERPWFRTIDLAVLGGDQYSVQTTDDMYFCKKAIKAGHKILAHGAVLCPHWDVSSGICYELPKDSRPYKSEVKPLTLDDWKAKLDVLEGASTPS